MWFTHTLVVLLSPLAVSRSSAAVLQRGGEVLEADSCCKSSHSWRAPGSPRLICCTSNITNHLGDGNTSLSSSLCLFFVSFCCLSRCHSSPSCLLSCPSLQLLLRWYCLWRVVLKNALKTRSGEMALFSFSLYAPQEIIAVTMTLEMRGRCCFSSFLSTLIFSRLSPSVNTTVTHAPRLLHPVTIWATGRTFCCCCFSRIFRGRCRWHHRPLTSAPIVLSRLSCLRWWELEMRRWACQIKLYSMFYTNLMLYKQAPADMKSLILRA